MATHTTDGPSTSEAGLSSKTLNLQQFCGVHDVRQWMNRPFVLDGHTAATDGKSFARVPGAGGYPCLNTDYAEKLKEALTQIDTATWFPMPEITLPAPHACKTCAGTGKTRKVECEECDGEGEALAETDYNTYEVTCKSCDGEGSQQHKGSGDTCYTCNGEAHAWPIEQRMTVPGVPFDLNPGLLSRIVGLEALRVAVIAIPGSDRKTALAFRCSTGDGLIMGMHAARDSNSVRRSSMSRDEQQEQTQ